MTTSPFIITIYIKPDKGPITGMSLDLLSIETTVIKTSGIKNDDARLEMIAQQIQAQFPDVDPQKKMHELRFLIARLSQIALFDGIVLQLPGSIPGDTPAPATLDVDILEKQKKRIEDLTGQLEKAVKDLETAQKMQPQLQADLIWYRTKFSDLNVTIDQLNQKIEEKDKELQKLEEKQLQTFIKAREYKEKFQKLEQEQAKMQLEIAQAQRDRKNIAQLRAQVSNAAKDEQQLRDTLDKSQQDLNECRNRVRQMADQIKRGAGGQNDPFAP